MFSIRRLTTRGSIVAIAFAAILVLAMASPALAATGSGTGGTGLLTVDLFEIDDDPPCARIDNLSFSQTITGTYTDGTNNFSGPATHNTADYFGDVDYYESPFGTHGEDAVCGQGTIGDPVLVIGNTSGSGISCMFTSGTYSRVADDIDISLSGNCTVGPGSPSATTETREAVLNDCFGGLPPDYCTTMDDEYTAS